MNRMRGKLAAIALLLTVASLSSGCGVFGNIFNRGEDRARKASRLEFVAESNIYHEDRVAYESVLRPTMRAARTARKCDDDCWLEFRLNQKTVQEAGPLVKEDLDAWGVSGKKPELYEAHKKTLRDALAEIVTIAKEFQ